MKKFVVCILFLTIIFYTQSKSFAEGNSAPTCDKKEPTLVTFIYLNGSNDYTAKNRKEFRKAFEKDVAKMHPVMISGFENNPLTKKQFLKGGEYKINPVPIVFYWGEKSLEEVEYLDKDLSLAEKFSPKISQLVRSVVAHCLHDAIWIQKYQNMSPVIDELQTVVRSETSKGHKVVLLGYSAGSFITYEYFLNKFTSLEPKKLMHKTERPEIAKMVKETDVLPTCLDALMEARIVTLNAYGKFNTNPDTKTLLKNYPHLDEYTEYSCFKKDEVKGVINFASPLILFYSDISDTKSSLNFLSQLMYKNILENDIFWLTVNYRNDPLGFPTAENITAKDISALDTMKITPNGGFVYNKSDIYVARTFISAHLAYWDTPKTFVRGVLNAYNNGFNKFYGITKN